MYRERMNSYYPQIIQAILEFQAIIDAEYPEFEKLEEGNNNAISDAHLLTMGIERVTQWEKVLNITPASDASVESRRAVVVARIRAQSKLNTNTINAIVNTFTDGYATSRVEDNRLRITIFPGSTTIDYKFSDIVAEIKRKLPAHMLARYNFMLEAMCDTRPAVVVTHAERYADKVVCEFYEECDTTLIPAVTTTQAEIYILEVQ